MLHLSRRRLLLGGPSLMATVTAMSAAAKIRPSPVGTPGDAISLREMILPTDSQLSDAMDRAIAKTTIAGSLTGRTRPIFVPAGVYPPLIRTHTFPTYASVLGDNPEQTILSRATDYGSTFKFGTLSTPAGLVVVRGITLKHGTSYTPGDTALDNKATMGAHIEINGAQGGNIEHCYLLRMPCSIDIVGGPGGLTVRKVLTIGVWDHISTALQEGVASVQIRLSPAWGNPKDISIVEPYFQGQKSASRSVIWTDIASNTRIVTQAENIGFQHNVLVRACETTHLVGGYYGCANINNATIKADATAGALTRGLHIGSGIFFDSARNAQLAIGCDTAAAAIDSATIGDFIMNGEANGLYGLVVNPSDDGNGPSLFNARIGGFTIEHQVGVGMGLSGLAGGIVNAGRITDYNCLNILGTTDPLRDAAISVSGKSRDLLLDELSLGGGTNFDVATAAGGNYSHRGVVVDPSLLSAGITVGSNVRFNAPT